MTCPDCGCDEKIPGDGGYFCKDCGLELDEIVISSKGVGKAIVIQIPEINFTFNPKKELDALRIGLKRNKLIDGWQKILGFNLNGPLKPELKPRALELITKAYERNRDVLLKSRDQIETSWKKVNNKFFFEVENILDIKWPSYEYDAFLSLSIKYGIHNSPRNYIIIQQDSSNLSNLKFKIKFRC